MAFSNTNKPAPNLGKFIADTLKKTVSASRSRVVIFVIILILQFGLVPLITGVLGFFYPDTYYGIKAKMAAEVLPVFFIGLIKYILLFVLVIKSPAESTGKRRFAKYALLLWVLFIWAIVDVMSSAFESDNVKSELAKKSLIENSIAIYGKVVFASYTRWDKVPGRKFVVPVAEKLSPNTSGYIVIAQLNRSAYSYYGLESLYHNFNYYVHNPSEWASDSLVKTNIEEKVPNLENCLRFIVDFMGDTKNIPKIPVPGKYIKIMYDPIENGIEMYTDAATWVTPSFDSIPGVNRP